MFIDFEILIDLIVKNSCWFKVFGRVSIEMKIIIMDGPAGQFLQD